jgi:pleckstrin domain-containing family G protein 5
LSKCPLTHLPIQSSFTCLSIHLSPVHPFIQLTIYHPSTKHLVHQIICPSIHLSIFPYIEPNSPLPSQLLIHLSIHLTICPPIYPSIHFSIHLSKLPFIHLTIHPSKHLSIHSSLHPSI